MRRSRSAVTSDFTGEPSAIGSGHVSVHHADDPDDGGDGDEPCA